MSFRALVTGIDDRIELIVRFLAILELFKQGMVDFAQVETFGDLTVRRLSDGERALDDREPRRLGRRPGRRSADGRTSDHRSTPRGGSRPDGRDRAGRAAGARAARRDPGHRDRGALHGARRGVRARGRGFTLVRVAGGYRYQTHPDMAPYVERFVLDGQTARLSAPALETLAIVAYKQPVSRAQLAAIRGVSVESTLSTLEQRGYVAEVGHDPGPGQAILYGTTQLFLERLGLDSLSDLPPLAEFVPEPSVVEALERGLLLRVEPDAEPAPTRISTEPDVADAGRAAIDASSRRPRSPRRRRSSGIVVDEPVDPTDAIAAEIDAEIEAEEAAEARAFVGATSDGEVRAEAEIDLAETAADVLDDDDGWVMPATSIPRSTASTPPTWTSPSPRLDRPDRRGAAAEGPRPGGPRIPAGLRRPDRGRAGHGRRRGRGPRPAGRSRARPHRARRRPRRHPGRARLLPAQQAGADRHDRVRPRGAPDGDGPGPERAAGVPGRPPRLGHRRAARAHERRRPHPPAHAPELRRGEGVPRRGRRRPDPRRAARRCAKASSSTTEPARRPRSRWCSRAATRPRSRS